MPRPIRVAYWNNIPSPYFTERLSLLAQSADLDVHGVFNSERNPDRSWNVDQQTWQFDAHWATRTRGGFFDATQQIRSLRPDLFVSLYGEPSFALNAPRAARFSRRWAIRVVPTYSAWEKRHPAKELVKRTLGALVDGAKVPGPDGRDYAERLGIPRSRVWEVQQSVPVEHFRSLLDRDTARERLGIPAHEFVFVYVGRLWEGKGIRVLLEAAERMSQDRPWSLLLVGDGPMTDEVRAREDVPVRMTGFVQRDSLPDVLAAADCLVFPTLGDPFGLVVEECMAAGMPVITSDQMGDARRRVTEPGAGLIVTEHTPSAWAHAMAQMLDPAFYSDCRDHAIETARAVGHEAYARDFRSFANHLLSLPPRRPHVRRLTRSRSDAG